MRFKAGTVGRVILARFDHGEEIVPALVDLCARERVLAGWFFLFGALADGKLVAGPKDAALPPEPVWRAFPKPHEIVGMGSIAERNGAPALHLHASLGRQHDVLTGCIRREGNVFVVVEAMILEINGITASRTQDERTGLELLSLE